MVGDTSDREAEVGLVALLVEVERDERLADEMGDQRADRRIGERDPDQIAWNDRSIPNNGNGVVAEMPHKI